MALFEPTNISPDMKYSAANGTVDVSEGLDIAWQVNGNAMTPMTGFSILITENNAENTPVHHTPVQWLDTPFSGADALGNPIRYQLHLSKEDTSSGHYFGYSGKTLTNVSVDFSIFTKTFGPSLLPFVFSYVNGAWWYGAANEGSDLTKYGITYTGTPAQDGGPARCPPGPEGRRASYHPRPQRP